MIRLEFNSIEDLKKVFSDIVGKCFDDNISFGGGRDCDVSYSFNSSRGRVYPQIDELSFKVRVYYKSSEMVIKR